MKAMVVSALMSFGGKMCMSFFAGAVAHRVVFQKLEAKAKAMLKKGAAKVEEKL